MARGWLAAALCGVLWAGMAAATDDLEAQISALWDARMYDQAYARLASALQEDSENTTASRLIATSYGEGLGVTADATRQVHHLRRAANGGDTQAMYALGEAYATGQGVAASAISAVSWFERSAKEHAESAFRYAELHLANPGQLHGQYEPVARLLFAAESGIPRAMFMLATLIESGKAEALPGQSVRGLLEEAAQTLPEARTALGIMHHRNRDFPAATKAFHAAHVAGDAGAAAYLGHYAEAGIEGPIDRKKALDYYRAAGEIAWAVSGAERIEAHLRSTEILGMRIYASTRNEIRHGLRQQGLERIGGAAHFDAYDVSALFETAERGVMTAGYAPGTPSFLAELHYRFDAPDVRQARLLLQEIHASLTSRYGHEISTSRELDTHLRQWRLEQVEIQLRFVARERRIHVTYHLAPFIDQLAEFLTRMPQEERGARDVF